MLLRIDFFEVQMRVQISVLGNLILQRRVRRYIEPVDVHVLLQAADYLLVWSESEKSFSVVRSTRL